MKTVSHEYFVSLEVAKLLKKAGFNWDTYSAYNKDGVFADKNRSITTWNDFADYYSAPTLEVVQRWFREVHHLHITIFSSSQESWMFRITKQHQNLEDGVYGEDFYSYEEALETGIKKALEMILEKGE